MKTKFDKFHFKSRQEKYNEGLTLGLLLGTAIGACAAILFSSQKGKDARKKIQDEVEKQTGDLGKQWDKLKGRAEDAAGDAKDALESAGSEAKSKLNNYTDKAESALRDGKETVNDKFQKTF